MEDRQTKTMGEMCRATYQNEGESGPRKLVSGGVFGTVSWLAFIRRAKEEKFLKV